MNTINVSIYERAKIINELMVCLVHLKRTKANFTFPTGETTEYKQSINDFEKKVEDEIKKIINGESLR